MQHSSAFLALVDDAKTRIETCEIEHIANMIQNNALDGLLIDVREESEYAQCFIPQAHHIGKGVIESKIESLIPNKSQKMYLYCGGGYRSALAADNLKKMGYQSVISVNGGIRSWYQLGLPLAQIGDQA